jgi:AcrR family transcriptional regulator
MVAPLTPEAASAPMAARRREFVAREIEQAGLRLFAERGYENVTIADIAAAAGISRRTFFRYFASKDHVVSAQSERLQVRVVAALERRPADEPACEALCNAILDTAVFRPEEREWVQARNRVLGQFNARIGVVMAPTVGGRLTALVADRMGVDADTDLRPSLVVLTVWAAAEAASYHWASSDGREPLIEALRRAFGLVRAGLDTLDGI